MQNGISLYIGLDNTFAENIELIKSANAHGIKRIFTSLHIPETNVNVLKRELHGILQLANEYGMEIISDVSPNTLSLLDMKDLDITALKQVGISTIRLDFGYSAAQIANFSHSAIKIQFNASTITQEFLEELREYHTDFAHIDALHNFYPREGTGLSVDTMLYQNKLLHSYAIKVAAFVPSYHRARSPLKKGLPTLECHRYQKADFAMRHLKELAVDSVFIGDSLPTNDEIISLSKLNFADDCLVLKAKLLTDNSFVHSLLTENIFTTRIDAADGAIRTQESRLICKHKDIVPNYTVKRIVGSITLDNMLAGRYAGELQIITKEQPSDKTVNVVAKIIDSDLLLLPYAYPNRKFRIELV